MAVVGTTVYYYGDDPDGFMAKLKAAIESGNYDSIEDLLSAMGVTVTPVDDKKDRGGPGIVSSEKPETVDSNNTIGNGAIVGIAAAALIVVLALLLLARRRRRTATHERSGSMHDALKHRQHTEDEGDSYTFEIDSETVPSPRIARVVGEEDSLISSWTPPQAAKRHLDPSPSDEEVMSSDAQLEHEMESSVMRSIEEHYCDSPSCEICAMKPQSGVRFQKVHSSQRRTRSSRSSGGDFAPNSVAL